MSRSDAGELGIGTVHDHTGSRGSAARLVRGEVNGQPGVMLGARAADGECRCEYNCGECESCEPGCGGQESGS